MRPGFTRITLVSVVSFLVTGGLLPAAETPSTKVTVSASQTNGGVTKSVTPIHVTPITVSVSELDNGVSRPLQNYTAQILAGDLVLCDFTALKDGSDKNTHEFPIAENVSDIVVYLRGTSPGVKYPANYKHNLGKVGAKQTVEFVFSQTPEE